MDRTRRDQAAARGLRILAVGQLPPPYGGQAVMMEVLHRAKFPPHHIEFVRMNFSRDMSDIGRASFRKFLELLAVIGKIVTRRLVTGCDVLLYPPAGPHRNPLLRDIVILCCTRWMFRHTIFYFHAGGVMSFVRDRPFIVQRLAQFAYGRPDLSIRPSNGAPADGTECSSRYNAVIAYGVRDIGPCKRDQRSQLRPRILYVGLIREDKGIVQLLEALALLKQRHVDAELTLVGAPSPRSFDLVVREFIREHDLQDRVGLAGVLTGEAKIRAYREADVFCFPTYFAAETSGLVVMEAMSCNLPIVATTWRGLPELIDDGDDGFLVPPRDATALAGRLQILVTDGRLRQRMGDAARRKYERKFTLDAFVSRFRSELDVFGTAICNT